MGCIKKPLNVGSFRGFLGVPTLPVHHGSCILKCAFGKPSNRLKRRADITVQAPPLTSPREYLLQLQSVIDRLDTNVVDRLVEAIWSGYLHSRTVFLFGNGGSAALASHLACDLGKGTINGLRKRLRAVCLSDNVPMMTAWANDLNYQEVYAEQLRNLIEPGDVAVAISGSGNSMNVVRGLEVAREAGATTMVLTGYDGGRVKSIADICLIVPSDNMQHIEDAHLCVAHAIFTSVRHRMKQADEP
jgi:D-sedoheptulose 7-phosphate isomerase